MVKKFLKGFIAGGIATIIDIGIIYILTEYFGIRYLRSASLGFTVGCVVNFLLHVFWVFCTKRISAKNFLMFAGFSLVGIGITILLMYLIVQKIEINYMVAKIITALIVYILNFIFRKKFIFVL